MNRNCLENLQLYFKGKNRTFIFLNIFEFSAEFWKFSLLLMKQLINWLFHQLSFWNIASRYLLVWHHKSEHWRNEMMAHRVWLKYFTDSDALMPEEDKTTTHLTENSFCCSHSVLPDLISVCFTSSGSKFLNLGSTFRHFITSSFYCLKQQGSSSSFLTVSLPSQSVFLRLLKSVLCTVYCVLCWYSYFYVLSNIGFLHIRSSQ